MKNGFKLPKNWSIRYYPTEQLFDFNVLRRYKKFEHMSGSGGYYSWNGNCNSGLSGNTEITYDQFCEYVLNHPAPTIKKENYKYLIKILKELNIR